MAGTRVIGLKLDADDGSFLLYTGITIALFQAGGTVSVAMLLSVEELSV